MLYENEVCDLIQSFKFFEALYLTPLFSSWMIETYLSYIWSSDLILPVPLHSKKLKKRSYNQSWELCRELASKVHLKTSAFCIRKTRDTKEQLGLSRSERIENLKDAFDCHPTFSPAGLNILLIDDVVSTGSTLREAASVLLKAGAKEVKALTIARNIIF